MKESIYLSRSLVRSIHFHSFIPIGTQVVMPKPGRCMKTCAEGILGDLNLYSDRAGEVINVFHSGDQPTEPQL